MIDVPEPIFYDVLFESVTWSTGHEWVDAEWIDPEYLVPPRPIRLLRGVWTADEKPVVQTITPLDHPEMFREFASLGDSEEAMICFANRYGVLTRSGGDFEREGSCWVEGYQDGTDTIFSQT